MIPLGIGPSLCSFTSEGAQTAASASRVQKFPDPVLNEEKLLQGGRPTRFASLALSPEDGAFRDRL